MRNEVKEDAVNITKGTVKQYKKITGSIILMMTGCALSNPSIGQEQRPNRAEEQEIEEIIVTVNRRAQSLQNVAGTAQAFNSEELDKSGVGSDFQNLQVVVPGLQISENEGFKEIYIRGIGTQSNGPTDDGATAVHLNGVYLPRSRGIGPVLYDLQRVEVNKGPQGTLRGRNATAGSLNFITRRPHFDGVDGYAEAGVGNFSTSEFEAAINVPVSDTLAFRASAFRRDQGNTYTNNIQEFTAENVDGVGAIEQNAVRLSALYKPNDRFTGLLVYDYAEEEGQGAPGNYFGQAFSDGETIDSLDDPFNQNFLTRGLVTNDIQGLNLVLTYDFDSFSVEYNGGYREHDAFNRNSRRPFQFGVANDGIPNVSDIVTASFNNFGTNHVLDVSEAFVNEVRFFSPDDARIKWTIGAFSLDEDQDEVRFDTSDLSLNQSSLGGEGVSTTKIKASSVFADATFSVTDQLRVKGGLRYTKDDKTSEGFQVQYAFDFGPSVTANDVRFSTPGYRPTRPGGRQLFNPLDPNVDPADFFLDGVGQFGESDNLGQLITSNPGSVSLTTTQSIGTATREFEESYTDWRAGIEYDLNDDHMLYASVNTGSRSGGLNPLIRLASRELSNSSFDREKLTSWELGSKNAFNIGDVPIRLNANLFLYQYEDQVLQVAGVAAGGGFTPGSTNVNANLITRNVNIAESEILGLELDGGAYLPYGFNLGWNIALLDSEYKDAVVLDGRPSAAGFNVDVSGNELLNVSDVNAVLHIGQDLETNWGSVDWRLTASYRSDFSSTPFNGRAFTPEGQEIPLSDLTGCCFAQVNNGSFFNDQVDAFTLFNFNIGANFGNENQYRIEGFVSNITEEAYATKQIINRFVNIAFLNNPRTAGLRLSAQF